LDGRSHGGSLIPTDKGKEPLFQDQESRDKTGLPDIARVLIRATDCGVQDPNGAPVCVIGPGYVGLPLAEALSKHLKTIGYRRNQKAVDELNATPGNTIEATTNQAKIKQADFVIIAAPTPVTKAKDPGMKLVESASKSIRSYKCPPIHL
jgi:hypothetical protein